MHAELGECLGTTHVESVQTCQSAGDGDGNGDENMCINTHHGTEQLDAVALARGRIAVGC